MTTEERDRIRTLERENRELRQANEILREGEAFVGQWTSAYFAPTLVTLLGKALTGRGTEFDRPFKK